MIKVAYDATILGAGHINPKARTGIFRVVESLFLELIQKNEIDIQAIALNKTTSNLDEASLLLYFQNCCPQFLGFFQAVYSSRASLEQFYLWANHLQQRLIEASQPDKILLYKVSRALYLTLTRLASLESLINFPVKTNLYHSLYFALPSQALLGNIPRLLTIYDLIPLLYPKLVTRTVYSRCLSTLKSIDCDRDWIISISEHTKQDFCNYTGMSGDRVFVTPLAAANYFYPVSDSQIISTALQRYGIPNRPYLLSLSTLEPRKNLSFLIRCFSKLMNEDPTLDLQLVLVGVNGWKNTDIFQAAQQNPQLQSRIIFTGYLPDADLSAIYSGATAFVYPSLYEGFGLPPLEAMQCGIPVITSNTSSLPEVVGDAGILVDPKQEDELCQAILQLLQNTELRTDLSQRSLERANQFSWATCAAQTVEVYKIAASL